jgi:chemotaxis protein methyltransferase WspC
MPAPDFARLLGQQIGLDPGSVGAELIERAVAERQRCTGSRDLDSYWARLTGSSAELQALIEAVVVSETWFFRDAEAFAALAREASGPWLAAQAQGGLRLLSLPCATGEEPYSMAMSLLDAGLPAERFAIDAVDISEQALGRARGAVYGRNAFRSQDLGYRERHFDSVASGHQVRQSVRDAVTFLQGNLLTAELTLGPVRYAAIFCRNVLIYLDRSAQRRAVEVLARLLAPEGLLFVGPSETSLLTHAELDTARIPLAFAFRKVAKRAPLAPSRLQHAPAPAASLAPVPAPRRPVPPPTPLRKQASQQAAPALDAEAHLGLVAELADRGQLPEATRLCLDHERLHGPSARLFYLMGLLREADSDPEHAAICHKKALYLDPEHAEAMTHLALLLEKHGDAAGAARLRQRALRVGSKGH